jgi:hypothetical protein
MASHPPSRAPDENEIGRSVPGIPEAKAEAVTPTIAAANQTSANGNVPANKTSNEREVASDGSITHKRMDQAGGSRN